MYFRVIQTQKTLSQYEKYEKKFTSQVRNILDKFQIVKNKARQICLFQAILGVIKSGKAQLPAIAQAIKLEGDTIQVKSIIHRLEDFFREVSFDYEQAALISFFLLR